MSVIIHLPPPCLPPVDILISTVPGQSSEDASRAPWAPSVNMAPIKEPTKRAWPGPTCEINPWACQVARALTVCSSACAEVVKKHTLRNRTAVERWTLCLTNILSLLVMNVKNSSLTNVWGTGMKRKAKSPPSSQNWGLGFNPSRKGESGEILSKEQGLVPGHGKNIWPEITEGWPITVPECPLPTPPPEP